MNKDYCTAKQAYYACRETEWSNLRKHLKDNNFYVVSGGNAGRGRKDYSSGGRLTPKYDLRNWLYIEGSVGENIDDINFFITFQPFEQDPNSKNMHILMDRIGIACYTGKYTPDKIMKNMKITDIELPLSKKDMEDIENIIIALAQQNV